MSTPSKLSPHEADAARMAAKAQLNATLAQLRYATSPSTLAQNAKVAAMEQVREGVDGATRQLQSGVETVKAHPGIAVSVAGAIGLYFARKPIARLLGFGREDTPPAPAPMPSHAPIRRSKTRSNSQTPSKKGPRT